MPFISIPVLFYPDDYDPERYEDLKVKVELKEGTMDVNINMLCQFHGTDQGTTMLSLADGTIVESTLSYDNFKEILAKTETLISVIAQRIN
jgi:hypothetical protein